MNYEISKLLYNYFTLNNVYILLLQELVVSLDLKVTIMIHNNILLVFTKDLINSIHFGLDIFSTRFSIKFSL